MNSPFEVIELIDLAAELTQEDKVELAMKWGRLWEPNQWIALEKFYIEMSNSFDIQGAAREDTLKKICKISLKMDEAIDSNDVDGFGKLSRTYDTLMKSGKFTEAQNKEDGRGFVNSVGELVAICEKEKGFIPRFDTEFSSDIVDKTIQDLKRYTQKLVLGDLGLAQQFEEQMAKLQRRHDEEEEEELLNDNMSLDDIEASVLKDVDFVDYADHLEAESDADYADELADDE